MARSNFGVTVEGSFSPARVEQVLRRKAKRWTEQRATRFGAAVIAEAQQIANAELRQDRPSERMHGYHRRRATSGLGGFQPDRKYVDSFAAFVEPKANGGAKVVVRNFHPAANLIEYGAPEHTIRPGGKVRLPVDGSRRSQANLLAWPAGYARGGGGTSVRLPKGRSVEHPGNRPYKIITRAMAKLSRGRGAVRL